MIFFLFGDDVYRSRQKLLEFETKFIREKDRAGLNLIKIEADKKTPAEKLQSEIMVSPFLADKKMVVIKNFLAEAEKAEQIKILDWLKEKKWKIDNLVFFWDEGLSASRKQEIPKLVQEAIKSKLALEIGKPNKTKISAEIYWQDFAKLSEGELVRLIKTELAKQGGNIETAAASLLVAAASGDSLKLANELKKLVAYKPGAVISTSDVKTLVNSSFQEDIFKLIDALRAKNNKLATKILHDQLANGAYELQILKTIASSFRALLAVKDCLEKKPQASADQLAAQLKLNPYVAKLAIQSSRNFSLAQLKNIYNELLVTEVKIKTSQANSLVLFDRLLTKLTS